MGINLCDMGTTAQFAPIMKKGTAVLSDGSVVMMVPDLNSASGNGVDKTGTAKVRFYKSSTDRTSFTLNYTWTPSVVFCSATFQAVMSMVLDSSNHLHVVWAGTNNSLNYEFLTYSAGAWTATTKQEVVASNSVTRRWRSVDIDVCSGTSGSTATIAISAYESKTNASLSAYNRLYIRNNNNTTWVNVFTEDIGGLSGGALTIKPGSEDSSVCFNTNAPSSNVVRLIYSYTRMTTTLDYGDNIRELTYNISTGTTGSATTIGYWSGFNQGVGSPFRRIWLYKIDGTHWQAAFAAGASQPQFSVARLTSTVYTGVAVDKILSSGTTGANANFTLYTAANQYTYITSVYCDNQVVFAYLYAGVPSFVTNAINAVLSACVFTYSSNTGAHVTRKDSTTRVLDNYYLYEPNFKGWQPVAIYGAGNNRNLSGDHQFNFLALFGAQGNNLTYITEARAVMDITFNAPTVAAPQSVQATDTPLLRTTFKSSVNYPFPLGKCEWQIATDSAFTVNLKDIIESDTNYKYMGSSSGAAAPQLTIQHLLSGVAPELLHTATWFVRTRIISDLGKIGSWSPVVSFQVLHYPAAIPRYPLANQIISSTDVPFFSWDFTDPEPTDHQSAYWIQVYRTDTNSLVWDSGVVSSTTTSASAGTNLSAYVDVPLVWQVALLDEDSVNGFFSTQTPFTISAPPGVALTNPVQGGTETSAAPPVAWSFDSTTSRTQTAYKVSVLPVEIADQFARVSASGWLDAPTGQEWDNYSGAAAKFTTDGTYGLMSIGDITGAYRAIRNNNIALDTDMTCQIGINVTAAGAPIAGKFVFRYTSTANFMVIGPNFNTDGTWAHNIQVYQGGTNTYSLNDGGNSGAPHTYTAGTDFMYRVKVQGQRVRMKAWAVGADEPTGWDLDTGTQAAISLPAGEQGMYAFQNTGVTNTTTVIRYTNYSIIDADPTPIATSGWISDTMAFYQFNSNIMVNNTYYVFKVEVQDSGGLQGSGYALVLTSWTHPSIAAFSVSPQSYGAIVSWDNTLQDTDFNSWRLWRRYNVAASNDLDVDGTASLWVLVYETQDGASSSYSFTDLMAPNQKSIDYVVTQTADRYGSLLDSEITDYVTVVLTGDRYYFIPDVSIGSIASFEARNVTNDTFTDDQEQSIILVVDRGNQVQVGSDKGLAGTLTIQLRDVVTARADREFLTYLAKNGIGCYMKSPFGDVTYIKFSPIAVNRIPGVGQMDMTDLSIPYTEVYTTTVQTTRTS